MSKPAPLLRIADALAHLPPRGCGVVYLLCWPGGAYVGLTRRPLPQRWREHLDELASGHHPNNAMRSAFARYGAAGIAGTVLEVAPLSTLEEREHAWIAAYGIANEAP